jgi:hypothetical protein
MIVILESFRVRATVAFELLLDPVDGRAIAIGSLAPISKFGQPFDGGLLAVQIEPPDENLNYIGDGFRLALRSGSNAGLSGDGGVRARDDGTGHGNQQLGSLVLHLLTCEGIIAHQNRQGKHDSLGHISQFTLNPMPSKAILGF